MPIRRYSPSEAVSFGASVEDVKEEKSYWGRKILAGSAMALAGTGTLMGLNTAFGETGQAHADNVIVYGGRETFDSEDTSQLYKQFLIDTRQVDPAKDNVIAVRYPAKIAPLDQITQRQATDIGVRNGQDILNTQIDPNQQTRVYGYSQGTAPAIELTNNNSNVVDALTIDKGPYGPGGIAGNERAAEFRDLGTNLGLVMSEPLPTNIPVTVRSSHDDIWSGGGNKDVGEILAAAGPTMMGDSHAMVNPVDPHTTEQHGNVTVEWYDGPVTPAPEVPTSNDAPLAPELPPATSSTTPSFFGEQACVAADGSQYYTPGDAPC